VEMNLDLPDWTQFGFAALSEQCPELEDMENRPGAR
jgi:hypothetical protein